AVISRLRSSRMWSMRGMRPSRAAAERLFSFIVAFGLEGGAVVGGGHCRGDAAAPAAPAGRPGPAGDAGRPWSAAVAHPARVRDRHALDRLPGLQLAAGALPVALLARLGGLGGGRGPGGGPAVVVIVVVQALGLGLQDPRRLAQRPRQRRELR